MTICPLITDIDGHNLNCHMKECAWWDWHAGCCAVLTVGKDEK